MAAGEGFEPSQTESESGVLPLHKPAICSSANIDYYTDMTRFVKPFFHELSRYSNRSSHSVRNTAAQQEIATGNSPAPIHASTAPTTSAATPATGD